MTRTTKAGIGARLALLLAALGWVACGARSPLHSSSSQPDDENGTLAGDGGIGGGIGAGSGGSTSTAATTSTGAGGVSGRGGSATGGSRVTSSGGNTTAKGGSGAGAGRGGSASGGGGRGGNGGSLSRSGGRGGGGGAGAGGAVTADAAPSRADALEVAPPVGTPTIDPNTGGITVATGSITMSGYVTGTTQGSGSSIALTYNATSFCASGTVGASPTYNSWAVAGFSVDEPSQESGSPTKPLALNGSEIAVTYSNRGGSRLEFQLWDGTGGRYWCNYLPTSAASATSRFKFSELNSKCWDGSGEPFTSGTAITAVQLLVPGDATRPVPFDYCFLGLRVN